jgi:6-methylsalicylate decarboxylase
MPHDKIDVHAHYADRSRVHYGSDFPFTPLQGCQYLAQQLDTSRHLDEAALDAILKDNAYDQFRVRAAPQPKESR